VQLPVHLHSRRQRVEIGAQTGIGGRKLFQSIIDTVLRTAEVTS